MNDITIKSTGFLIDELITTRFKVEINPTPDNIQRMRMLDAAIRLRLHGREDDIFLQVTKLQVVLRQCWDAQEVIRGAEIKESPYVTDEYLNLRKIAKAGIKAQETNAMRNKIIREIDEILGELDIAPLEKTYA